VKRAISCVLLVAMTATAVADPHRILVLQTEGRADAATRLKIDATIARLATADGAQVSPGDITFTDAAAAVGCKPEVPACRDEVLGMLAVDEVIYATTALKPGGVEIEVHRVTRGGTTREGKMLLATGQSADTLDGLAPLFSGGTTTAPVTPPPTPTEPAPTVLLPATEPQPSPITTQPAAVPMPVDEGGGQMRRRLLLTGIVGGGALMVVGFLLWGEAGTIQEEIDTHPINTAGQLDDLKQLEQRGDSYAAWGNVLFLGGAAIGAISAYFYVKQRKARAARTARIGPAVFDHGAGITLTIGGSP